MNKFNTLIALDIDGTITYEMREIPANVVDYLHSLVEKGHQLVFITGRTFQFAHKVLKVLNFPYYLAVQNGAIILEMPEEKILKKHYLDQTIIPIMEEICEKEETDFVIYGGFEFKDACFYRPEYFSPELLEYLKARREAFGETWYPISSFENSPLQEFPSIKCFGREKNARAMGRQIEKALNLHVPVIKDPFNEEYYVVQSTHPLVSKGQALQDLIERKGFSGKVIAVGDDHNDLAMFEKADLTVVMNTAPPDMLKNADIIAPAASEFGVIKGIDQALIDLLKEKA